MKRSFTTRIGDFMAGQGFYILLLLCVAAIGVSGYILFSALGGPEGAAEAGNPTQVTVPSPSPSSAASPAPAASPSPSAAPSPSVSPSASPSPSAQTAAEPEPTVATAVSATAFTWPLKGELLGEFSLEVLAYDPTMGDWRVHSGIDIAANAGAEVCAIAEGTVSAIYHDDLMGTTVVVDHGGELLSTYCNLASQPPVSVGDAVVRSTVIGSVGDTAIAESALPSHLHLEMSQNGLGVDPLTYLPEK